MKIAVNLLLMEFFQHMQSLRILVWVHLHGYRLATPIMFSGPSATPQDLTQAPWVVLVVYNLQWKGSLDAFPRIYSADRKSGVTSSYRHDPSQRLSSIESSMKNCTRDMDAITYVSSAGKLFIVIHSVLALAATLSGLYLRAYGKWGVSVLARRDPSHMSNGWLKRGRGEPKT